MTKGKNAKEPRAIQFQNGMGDPVPGFAITRLSEQDIRELHAGRIPAWLRDTIAYWVRDNPTPSETQDQFERSELEMARRRIAELERQIADLDKAPWG